MAAAHVCQVWWAHVGDVRPAHDALLTTADLHRRSRLTRAEDRRRATAGSAVARLVLGALLGVAPPALEIDRTCRACGAQHGKPWLPSAPELQFSVSHSGAWVTVAVQRGGAVGVDVEEIGRFDPPAVDELAREVLAAEEQAELTRLPAGERALAFTTYWTRKEAVVKATGEGLMASLDALVVSPPDQPPRIIRWDGRAAQARRLWLHPLQPRAGYVAALAAVGRAPSQVVEHDAGPILRGVPAG